MASLSIKRLHVILVSSRMRQDYGNSLGFQATASGNQAVEKALAPTVDTFRQVDGGDAGWEGGSSPSNIKYGQAFINRLSEELVGALGSSLNKDWSGCQEGLLSVTPCS